MTIMNKEIKRKLTGLILESADENDITPIEMLDQFSEILDEIEEDFYNIYYE